MNEGFSEPFGGGKDFVARMKGIIGILNGVALDVIQFGMVSDFACLLDWAALDVIQFGMASDVVGILDWAAPDGLEPEVMLREFDEDVALPVG